MDLSYNHKLAMIQDLVIPHDNFVRDQASRLQKNTQEINNEIMILNSTINHLSALAKKAEKENKKAIDTATDPDTSESIRHVRERWKSFVNRHGDHLVHPFPDYENSTISLEDLPEVQKRLERLISLEQGAIGEDFRESQQLFHNQAAITVINAKLNERDEKNTIVANQKTH